MQRAGEGSTADMGAGRGEERTENMKLMVVTLEVSKLSGWLNDAAPCRKGEAYGAGRAPGRGPAGEVAHAACIGQGSATDGGQGTRVR